MQTLVSSSKGTRTIKGPTSTSPNTFVWEGLLLVSFEVHHGRRSIWVWG